MKAEVRVVFTYDDMVAMAMEKLKAQGFDINNMGAMSGHVEYVEYNDEADEYSVSFQLKRSGDE
jgi:hypothetical protein|tara:strand:+ start:47 stop:238 length:192 start_codon:yes stop_codon:yes gene_type:complete